MSLSRNYTAQTLWHQVIRDVESDQNLRRVQQGERFTLMNRGILIVTSQLIGTMLNDYMATVVLTPSTNTVNLATAGVGATPLRIYRAALTHLVLESTSLTKPCKPCSQPEFMAWNITDLQNRTAIAFTIEGDTLSLKKPAALSYGTLTLHYPKLPDLLTTDTDGIDLPDGPAIEILILKLKSMLRERYNFTKKDTTAETQILLKNFYQSYGVVQSKEEIESQVKALS